MCGIVGYVGFRSAQDVLIEGLRKLEYRGYDSAGISLQRDGRLDLVRSVGNLDVLVDTLSVHSGDIESGLAASDCGEEHDENLTDSNHLPRTGIGHTRWATHGEVAERNAHPQSDTAGKVHVVVNGIVENYLELRQELADSGVLLTSDTDVEVIAHLIAGNLESHSLVEAVRLAYSRLSGHYAFVAMCVDEPDVLVGVRKDCPLIIGRGDGEHFIASAIPAFLRYTRRVQVLNDDELIVITPDNVDFQTISGERIERQIDEVDWDAEAAEKGSYETFMLKEINEQADAVAKTLLDRTIRDDGVDLPDLGEIDDELLTNAQRVVIVACGTSYHAGLVGKYSIEEWARVPVEIEVASEYRYRNPVVGPGSLVIGITQSGETLDTLAAMRLARERGATVLAVTNVMGSQATRDADGLLHTRAGIEIGVAATKTFVAQVTAMYLLALRMAELRKKLDRSQLIELVGEVKKLPQHIDELLESSDAQIDEVAQRYANSPFFLYLGRHIGLPICLEGALKLKEISYIATDAYAAGEMKHGPIALLDNNTPVVVVATDSPVLSKVTSNMQEVKVRGAQVIAVATEGSSMVNDHADHILRIPRTHWMLQPLLAVIPLQLLAYKIARLRGLNVDQPRNLAKTVTVE